jgi:uncharacterized protein
MQQSLRYNDLNSWLRRVFGQRVQKVTIDAGFTCPNRDGTLGTGGSIHCNELGSGTGAHRQGLSATQQLAQGIASLGQRYGARAFIAYFQAFSNTYAATPELRRLYEEALAVEGVVGLSIGTRPDCITPATLGLLHELTQRTMVWVEYGLQSAHDSTLSRINRGHTVRAYRDIVPATRARGVRVCTHLILGLPGETRDDMLATVDEVVRVGVDGVKLHLLYVVRGTPMEMVFRQGQYTCMEQNAYVDIVCDIIERLAPQVVVQRLTGDPHRSELVAPDWAVRKQQTLDMVRSRLVQRGSWQGKAQGAHMGDWLTDKVRAAGYHPQPAV